MAVSRSLENPESTNVAGSRLLEEASLPVIRWLFEIVREKTDVIWHIIRADLHLNGSILNNSRLGFQEPQ